jgi:hypothetical protein
MPPRDIALTVLELQPREFHWVLMEAAEAESEECLGYKPVDCAVRPCTDYGQAVIEGAVALRQLQGLAPRSPVVVPAATRTIAPRMGLLGLGFLSRAKAGPRPHVADQTLLGRLKQLL